MKFAAALLVCIFTAACAGASIERRMDEAEALVGVGELAAALKVYESISKKCPSHARCAEADLHIADIRKHLSSASGEVLAAYSLVIDRYPLTEASRVAHERRADFYERMGNHAGAAGDYAMLLQYYHSSDTAPRYLLKLGEAYLAMGDRAQARIELEGLVRDVEYDPDIRQAALFGYAESFFLDGRLGLAEKWYAALVNEYPDSVLAPEAYMKIATCQEERGFLGDAIGTLAKAKKAYPNVTVIEDRLRSMRQRGKVGSTRDLPGVKDNKRMRDDKTKDAAAASNS